LSFAQVPAEFSPQEFDVSGLLVIADPDTLCDATPDFALQARDKFVMALRGNCTFWQKGSTSFS
jgi:hypothetical protein